MLPPATRRRILVVVPRGLGLLLRGVLIRGDIVVIEPLVPAQARANRFAPGLSRLRRGRLRLHRLRRGRLRRGRLRLGGLRWGRLRWGRLGWGWLTPRLRGRSRTRLTPRLRRRGLCRLRLGRGSPRLGRGLLGNAGVPGLGPGLRSCVPGLLWRLTPALLAPCLLSLLAPFRLAWLSPTLSRRLLSRDRLPPALVRLAGGPATLLTPGLLPGRSSGPSVGSRERLERRDSVEESDQQEDEERHREEQASDLAGSAESTAAAALGRPECRHDADDAEYGTCTANDNGCQHNNPDILRRITQAGDENGRQCEGDRNHRIHEDVPVDRSLVGEARACAERVAGALEQQREPDDQNKDRNREQTECENLAVLPQRFYGHDEPPTWVSR
jgi:hypothetical protein